MPARRESTPTSCDECGGRLSERKATPRRPYLYDLSGLDGLQLTGIVVRHCKRCDVDSPVIPRIGQVHQLIADALLRKPTMLSGSELRFLRKHSGYRSAAFANLLGLDPAHLSRVENGHYKGLGRPADRLARGLVDDGRPQSSLRNLLTSVAAADIGKEHSQEASLRLRYDAKGWHVVGQHRTLVVKRT